MSTYTLKNYANQLTKILPETGGAVSLIFCVDEKLIAETVKHQINLGFDAVVLFIRSEDDRFDNERVINVIQSIDQYDEMWPVFQTVSRQLVGHWINWGFNGEFFYFPFCENRNVKDLITFMKEERRQTVFGTVIDAYSRNLYEDSTGVSFDNTGIDTANYFSTDIEPHEFSKSDEDVRNRVKRVHGGLRWRFVEWIASGQYRIDRVPLFLMTDQLEFDENGQTENAEFYAYKCAHHYNPTAAVVSFRTIIDLRHNPSSRAQIWDLNWTGTETFSWNSGQLLRLGIIETGQWF